MLQQDIQKADRNSLERRRHRARLRQEREEERRELVFKAIDAERSAGELRAWLEAKDATRQRPELMRMLDWARRQLSELEAIADPETLATSIRERELFPEIDGLRDPLGEPPGRTPWGR